MKDTKPVAQSFGCEGSFFYQDVEGAPLALGQTVTVDCAADDSCDDFFVGHRGEVRGLYYASPQHFPSEPLVLVRFDELGEDLFFPHELRGLLQA